MLHCSMGGEGNQTKRIECEGTAPLRWRTRTLNNNTDLASVRARSHYCETSVRTASRNVAAFLAFFISVIFLGFTTAYTFIDLLVFIRVRVSRPRAAFHVAAKAPLSISNRQGKLELGRATRDKDGLHVNPSGTTQPL